MTLGVGLRRVMAVVVAAVATLFAGTTAAAEIGRNDDIAIIVHPDTPVDDLGLAEMRKVFLGDRQYWKPGLAVILLVRAPVARERNVVLKTIYQMTEAQFKQYWIAKIFRAEAPSAPKILYSSEQVTEFVAAIPGTIGFILSSDVRPGVKVLRVDGRLPGEPFYPLR